MEKDYATPKWAEKGKLRWTWWCWESLEHYARTGDATVSVGPGSALWGKDWFERIHSEDTVKMMADMGVNLAITHFHKGMGLEFEKPSIKKTKELVRLCHKHQIKVFGYMQMISIFYETFFKEVPQAREWIRRTRDGRLQDYPMPGVGYYWRMMTCINQKGFIDYTKKCIEVGINEVGLDGFHFDGPDSTACYCERCQVLFRSYLKERFPEPRERFGIDGFDHILIPPYGTKKDIPAIYDPLYQEWIHFRTERNSQVLRELNSYIKDLNPEVCLSINPHWSSIKGDWANHGGESPPSMFPYHDSVMTESEVLPGFGEGRLNSQAFLLKVAQAGGIQLLSSTAMRNREDLSCKRIKLDLAEVVAFGSTPGATWALRPNGGSGDRGFVIYEPKFRETLSTYLHFFRDHPFLYLEAEPVNEIALLWSDDSLNFDSVRAYASIIELQDVLTRHHIMNRIVFDTHLKGASGFHTLIIPDAKCLSDDIRVKISEFVRKGGRVILNEEAGSYDENFRQRYDFGLTSILKQTDQVRVLPKNKEGLIEAVRSTLDREIELETDAPENIVIEFTTLPEKRKAIHIINHSKAPATNVFFRLSSAMNISHVTLHSPDGNSTEKNISLKKGKNRISFVVPRIDTYTVVLLE